MGSLAKLDFKTRIFLHITKANIVRHVTKINDVYVFDGYDDFANYFKMHTGNYLDKDLIDKTIYTTGKNGQVIAFKGLCEEIIASQLGLSTVP